MKAEKILFITQEINPYVPESQLTKLGREIPMAALDNNREARVFMPKWGNINERRNQLHPVQRISGMNMVVDDTDYQLIIKVASIVGTRMQVYFIDEDEFFGKRLAELDREGKEYTDNYKRAVFYSRSVLETVKKLRWAPNVVHCQGWTSAFAPLYLKTAYEEEPCFRDCRVVYTVTDNKLTLNCDEQLGRLIAYRNADASCVEDFDGTFTPTDLHKLAIKFADAVTFDSPNPPAELVEYANSLGKLILATPTPGNKDFLAFFDQIWSEGKTEKPE